VGTGSKKNDHGNQRDDHEYYFLLQEKLHEQLLDVKVTIIHVFGIRNSRANAIQRALLSIEIELLITFAFQKNEYEL
jgi:hypothetical protein